MNRIKTVLIAACMLPLMGASPAGAQGVESIMRQRERLELTEDQLASLDAIRREIVQERTDEMAEMAELRSRLEAGDARRSDLMAAMEDRRATTESRAEERRALIEGVLTEEQLALAQESRTRAGRARATMRRGARPGMRGRRPQAGPRGNVGRGDFGPGAQRRFRARPGPRGFGLR